MSIKLSLPREAGLPVRFGFPLSDFPLFALWPLLEDLHKFATCFFAALRFAAALNFIQTVKFEPEPAAI